MITEKEIDDSMDVSPAKIGTYEILLLTVGFLGLHRFYVKKYISGAIMLLLGIFMTVSEFITIPYISIISSVVIYGFVGFDITSALWGFNYDGKGRPITDEGSGSKDSTVELIIISVLLIAFLVAYPLFDRLYIVQIVVYAIAWIVYLIKNIKEIRA